MLQSMGLQRVGHNLVAEQQPCISAARGWKTKETTDDVHAGQSPKAESRVKRNKVWTRAHRRGPHPVTLL